MATHDTTKSRDAPPPYPGDDTALGGLNIPGLNLSGISPDKIQEVIARLSATAGRNPVGKQIMGVLEQMSESGLTPRMAMGLSDDNMEAMYHYAYTLYNQGQYEKAIHLFRILSLLEPIEPKYMIGGAACLHRMGDLKNAVAQYMAATFLNSKDPMPHFYGADCYIKLEMPTLAIMSLRIAIDNAGDNPEYALVKERAELMLAGQEQEWQRRKAAQKAATSSKDA